jgi:hypothetical protein
MTAQSNRQPQPLAFGFIILMAAVLFVLNYPNLLIETPPLWYSSVVPALLTGLIGTVLRSKPPR